MKHSLILFALICCQGFAAPLPSWSVQPNICITTKLGDSCKFDLTISTYDLSDEVHCIFINEQRILCTQQNNFSKSIALSIDSNSVITLKNSAGDNILSHALLIKYTGGNKQRRRIREPWSIF